MAIVIFILVLSFLVIIHELGHFVAARWAKVRVEEFGIGYPPRALKLFKWRQTLFSLNWIPVGGFVSLQGENGPEDQAELDKALAKSTQSWGPFYVRPAWQRLVIVVAGVTVNFLFGILAFSLVFSQQGIPTPITTPRIGYVAANSPAEQAGLQLNTEITAFILANSEKQLVKTPQEVIDFVDQHQGETVQVETTALCQGLTCPTTTKTTSVYLRTDEELPANQGSMGVAFAAYVPVFYPWYEMVPRSIYYGLSQAIAMGLLVLSAFVTMMVSLFGGTIPADVAGPVGIVDQVVETGLFKEGALAILNFAGLISINLAVINLLPIPALDGGRAFFILLEKVLGRHKIAKIEGYANYGGMAFLLALIVLITVRDVGRILAR